LTSFLWLCALSLAAFPLSAGARPQILSSPLPKSTAAATTPAPPLDSEKALEEALKKQRASLETQRQAIHRQLAEKVERTEVFLPPVEQFVVPLPAPTIPDCPALDSGKVSELVSAAAREQSLDPALLKAVIRQESAFKPCAVSLKGAQGLMQLMPATARELHVADVFDPAQNVQAGAAYLKQMLQRYQGDLRLALVGYNAGPSRADQAAEEPYPLETQNYVASILADLGIDPPASASAQEDLAPPDDPDDTDQEVAPIGSEAQSTTHAFSPTSPIFSEEKTKLADPKP
jgi:soluble lytic murein transglycosylase-like protein